MMACLKYLSTSAANVRYKADNKAERRICKQNIIIVEGKWLSSGRMSVLVSKTFQSSIGFASNAMTSSPTPFRVSAVTSHDENFALVSGRSLRMRSVIPEVQQTPTTTGLCFIDPPPPPSLLPVSLVARSPNRADDDDGGPRPGVRA